jgi:hypothetical protein
MLKNVASQKVRFSLYKSAARIANPTIAEGDFKVSKDGGAQANVGTAPTSDAAGLVTWSPSQAETNADQVVLLCLDAAGDEWEPLTLVFDTLTDTSVAAILVDTAEIGTAGAGLTAVPWNAAWDAEVQSEATDALNAYDPPTNAEMEARTLATASYLTAAAVNAEVVDVLRTDTLPDSYSADAAQPTIAQAVLEIRQFLMERSVTAATVTVKKPNGSTTAMTFTLDDGTNPTSITRAS